MADVHRSGLHIGVDPCPDHAPVRHERGRRVCRPPPGSGLCGLKAGRPRTPRRTIDVTRRDHVNHRPERADAISRIDCASVRLSPGAIERVCSASGQRATGGVEPGGPRIGSTARAVLRDESLQASNWAGAPRSTREPRSRRASNSATKPPLALQASQIDCRRPDPDSVKRAGRTGCPRETLRIALQEADRSPVPARRVFVTGVDVDQHHRRPASVATIAVLHHESENCVRKTLRSAKASSRSQCRCARHVRMQPPWPVRPGQGLGASC